MIIIKKIARRHDTSARNDRKIREHLIQEEIDDLRKQRDLNPKRYAEIFNQRIVALNKEQFQLSLSYYQERYWAKARNELRKTKTPGKMK